MRHGRPSDPDRVGCYFCNDVVAPADSVTERTLDQQCTVSRPGLSSVAGALAGEMAAALVAGGGRAEAKSEEAVAREAVEDRNTGASLGAVPHMVRGCLFGFTQGSMRGPAFSQCVGCSDRVLERLRSEGWGFVKAVAGNGGVLEAATGLDELRRRVMSVEVGEEGAEGGEGSDDWEEI